VLATSLLEEGREVGRVISNKCITAHVLCGLARVAHAEGEDERALALYAESMALARELEDRGCLIEGLEGVAAIDLERDALQQATHRLARAQALREALETPLPPCRRIDHEHLVTTLRRRLGEQAFAQQWEAGRGMSLEQTALETSG
jgi:hypothetical protein